MKTFIELFVQEVLMDCLRDIDWPSALEAIKALLDHLLK